MLVCKSVCLYTCLCVCVSACVCVYVFYYMGLGFRSVCAGLEALDSGLRAKGLGTLVSGLRVQFGIQQDLGFGLWVDVKSSV